MEEGIISLNIESISLGSPQQLASEIGPNNDLQILKVVIFSYIALREEKVVDENWPEDKITRELCVQIQIYVTKNGINTIPIHQYPIYLKNEQVGRPPTIDFVFRKGFEESHYLGFECKIVNDKKITSIRDYIDEGMNRFLSGKYAKNEKVGGMVAYLINRELLNCVAEINEKVMDKLGIENCLTKTRLIKEFNGLYTSKHKRVELLDYFRIYHIFMYFNT